MWIKGGLLIRMDILYFNLLFGMDMITSLVKSFNIIANGLEQSSMDQHDLGATTHMHIRQNRAYASPQS